MRIQTAAAAVMVIALAAVTAVPANARTIRVSYLPKRYQTYESCVDFEPTIKSPDAMITKMSVRIAANGAGVPSLLCPHGVLGRVMHQRGGVKFVVRFEVFDSRSLDYLHGHYVTQVRLLG